MTYNDVLRSLRYSLDLSDKVFREMIELSGSAPSLDELSSYLKAETDPDFRECPGEVLAACLDGLVLYKRGKSLNRPFLHTPERVTNNLVLKKLRVAFELQEADLIGMIERAGLRVSRGELSSFFRSPSHRNYRPCGDQFLRAVMKGIAS